MGRWIRNIAVVGLLAAFLLPAIGFALNLVRGADGVSVTEKRVLATLPSFQGDARNYTSEFDRYLEDNFGFRMPLIRVARKIRDNLGEDAPQVVMGQDGYRFLGNLSYRDEFEGQGRWDEDKVQAWVASLTGVNAALASRDIPFAAFIALDKARAYPEKTPTDWNEGARRFRAALHRQADPAQTGLIDAEPFVQAAKARGVQTFYLGDSHWTSSGTYDLAIALMDGLDPDQSRPRFQPAPPQLQRSARVLDLEAMSGLEATQEPDHTLIKFPPSRPRFRTRLPRPEDGSWPVDRVATLRILGTEDAPEGTLVIVGDSFADAMVGHFRPSYSEIIRIHHGAHVLNVTLDEVLAYNPVAVLYATAERQAFPKDRPFAELAAPTTP